MPSLYIRVHFVSIFEIKQGIFAFMSEFVNTKYEHMKSLKSTENKRKIGKPPLFQQFLDLVRVAGFKPDKK